MKNRMPQLKLCLPEKWDKEADVVVAGFGAAGSVAAIEAHDCGASVLILEAMRKGGGACRLSGGWIYGCRTSIQKATGIVDSHCNMLKYNMAISGDLVDQELSCIWAKNCGKLVDWLANIGVKFSGPIFSGQEKLYANVAKPVPRGHRAEGEGAGLWRVLEENVRDRGIECMFETRACELIAKRSSGKSEVFGVRAESKGNTLNIKANKAVILCTGGYSSNVDFFKKFCTKSLPFNPNPMVASDNGDGIAMAQAVGADLFAIDNVGLRVLISRGWPSLSFASYVRHPPNGNYVWANLKGKRFMDETTAYSHAPLIIATQPESRCYMIFDENTKETGGENIGWKFSHDLGKEISTGAIRKADSVRNLARIIGTDPDTLEDTIHDWNKNAADGRDPDFGRTIVGPISTAPFYAGNLAIYVVSSYGGVKVNTKGQVIDVFRRAVSRLFAAGSTTGGCVGKAHLGGGEHLSKSMTFGRIAGKEASAETSWE